MPKYPRPRRIAIAGARAQLAGMNADVVNVSHTGALIRAVHDERPGAQGPLVLQFDEAAVRLTARVVRCEPARARRRKSAREFALGVVFVNPSNEAQATLDRICQQAITAASRARRLCVSFVRRCPDCESRAVYKETKRHFCCMDCGRRFVGIRVGIVRFAR